ncbi:hypothetical protein KIN20_027191 [Parelaphostrongylus tenuis]|uniref:Uncharacterized protein n=1 Tax=Parelaphostrongylus tenuis TaxID=148309 RepID=A0AAD5QZ98_PARTN|nr:hypothetical protein KIN20_027191 [Parelaphostrongylus tenuis]
MTRLIFEKSLMSGNDLEMITNDSAVSQGIDRSVLTDKRKAEGERAGTILTERCEDTNFSARQFRNSRLPPVDEEVKVAPRGAIVGLSYLRVLRAYIHKGVIEYGIEHLSSWRVVHG